MNMDILLYILFTLVGSSFTINYFNYKKISTLKDTNKTLKKLSSLETNKILNDKIKELGNDNKRYIRLNNNLKSQLNKSNSEVDKLKRYLGNVGDKEFGIIKRELIYDKRKEIQVEAEFKVIQRGDKKVKITVNIDNIKVMPTIDHRIYNDIKSLLDGWYNIDDPELTWIEPNISIKRDIDIDGVINND